MEVEVTPVTARLVTEVGGRAKKIHDLTITKTAALDITINCEPFSHAIEKIYIYIRPRTLFWYLVSVIELCVLQIHASDFIWTQQYIGKLLESIWTCITGKAIAIIFVGQATRACA